MKFTLILTALAGMAAALPHGTAPDNTEHSLDKREPNKANSGKRQGIIVGAIDVVARDEDSLVVKREPNKANSGKRQGIIVGAIDVVAKRDEESSWGY